MFRQPIRSVFRKGPPPSLTSYAFFPRAAPTAASQHSQTSRSISSLKPYYRTPITSRALLRSFQHPLPRLRGRPFSSTAHGFGNQPYKRFNDPRRQPFLWRLLGKAKPHHFVIIGLVISGFYIYNSETVEVRHDDANLDWLMRDPYGGPASPE